MKRKLYLANPGSDDWPEDILMTADLETEEVRINCGNHYYYITIGIDKFLEFADFIRANMHADADGRWENVGELFEKEKKE